MTQPYSETSLLPDSGHPAIDWDCVLQENEQLLRSLVAKRLSGRGDSSVDDILQEVAVAAHASREGSLPPAKALPWLKQVAVNKVCDLWRKVERKDRLQDHLREEGAPRNATTPSPFEWVMAVEQTELVHNALDQLSEDERRPLEKKYLNGQSCRNIASEEGVKEKTVEYRLGKARRTMRSILEKIL